MEIKDNTKVAEFELWKAQNELWFRKEFLGEKKIKDLKIKYKKNGSFKIIRKSL